MVLVLVMSTGVLLGWFITLLMFSLDHTGYFKYCRLATAVNIVQKDFSEINSHFLKFCLSYILLIFTFNLLH